jgi:cyclopropane-fatty-acyl-phospholipid synthase
VGAFEHFGHDRYDDFFAMAYRVLPDDGVMLLHTITRAGPEERRQLGLPVTMSLLRFTKFILTEIFPGGRLPLVSEVVAHCRSAGFGLERTQPLQPH